MLYFFLERKRQKKVLKVLQKSKMDVSLHPLSMTATAEAKEKGTTWPVRLVGLGREVFILEIRGSNPLRATEK